MKLLVIRFSSIGDIILTTPAIRCLKQQVAGAEVHFLTKLSFKKVTEHNPYIDKFHYYDDNLSALIQQLKTEHYDYIVDLHKNFRTFIIKSALRVEAFTYKKESLQKFLLTKFHINFMSGRHIAIRCLDTVARFGVKDDGGGLDYFIPPQDRVKAEDLPLSHSMGYVAIVIGASYYTKKLPVHKLQQLCSQIALPIVLVGGKEDITEGEQIATVNPIKIYNACGKFNLNESADIVRKAKVVISHDTGLQYIACAFNKPVIAIWGGTSPKLDVEPFYGYKYLNTVSNKAMYKNMIVPNLLCQPCSNFGTATCPVGHFKCMEEQDLTKIQEAVDEYLR
jgi:ADP-heptose:LPS heptosyltransferase